MHYGYMMFHAFDCPAINWKEYGTEAKSIPVNFDVLEVLEALEACRPSKRRLPSHAWSGVLPPGQAWLIWIGIHMVHIHPLLECPS